MAAMQPFVVTFRFATHPIVRGECTLDAVLGGEIARRVESREEAILATPARVYRRGAPWILAHPPWRHRRLAPGARRRERPRGVPRRRARACRGRSRGA